MATCVVLHSRYRPKISRDHSSSLQLPPFFETSWETARDDLRRIRTTPHPLKVLANGRVDNTHVYNTVVLHCSAEHSQRLLSLT